MDRLIAIVGPTAAGKSALALQLASRFGCEIISGDSMCVYRGMDIGTAKPTQEERRQVRHHLVDILDPAESFSVVDFQRLAGEAVNEVNRRGRIPVLVGGTGLYVQSLLEGYRFNPTPKTILRDPSVHADSGSSAEELHARLTALDPVSALRIHPHDKRRILRALEVALSERRPISRDKRADSPTLIFDCIVFGLTLARPVLYRRIDERVDKMLAGGLLDETKTLASGGIPANATAWQAIGYKEMLACIRGEASLEEAAAHVKQSSRRYAKRQMTWFRRMPYIHWFDMTTENSCLEVMARMVAEKFSIK